MKKNDKYLIRENFYEEEFQALYCGIGKNLQLYH
jgi:hypothetical protein